MPSTPNYIRFIFLPFTLLDTSSSLFDCDTLLYSFHLAPLIPFGLKKQKRKKPIGIFTTPLIPKPKLPNQFSQIAIKRTNGFLLFLSFFLHMTKCTDLWRQILIVLRWVSFISSTHFRKIKAFASVCCWYGSVECFSCSNQEEQLVLCKEVSYFLLMDGSVDLWIWKNLIF